MLVCFLIRYRKEVNLNGKGGGEEVGTEGRETVIRIYCEEKNLFFNKTKKHKVFPDSSSSGAEYALIATVSCTGPGRPQPYLGLLLFY